MDEDKIKLKMESTIMAIDFINRLNELEERIQKLSNTFLNIKFNSDLFIKVMRLEQREIKRDQEIAKLEKLIDEKDPYLTFRSLNDCGNIHLKLDEKITKLDKLDQKDSKRIKAFKKAGLNVVSEPDEVMEFFKKDGEKESICKCGRTYKAHFINDSYKTCEYLSDLKPSKTCPTCKFGGYVGITNANCYECENKSKWQPKEPTEAGSARQTDYLKDKGIFISDYYNECNIVNCPIKEATLNYEGNSYCLRHFIEIIQDDRMEKADLEFLFKYGDGNYEPCGHDDDDFNDLKEKYLGEKDELP